MAKLHISNEVEVWHGYAKQVGHNGQSADACVICWQAPQVGGDEQWVYLTTNGGPVIVGTVENDGGRSPTVLTVDPDTSDWWDGNDNAWLRDVLEAEYVTVVGPYGE
jgi:hypothetical protein